MPDEPSRRGQRSDGDDPRIALIDGANAAHAVEGDGPTLRNIHLIRDAVSDDGCDPVVIVDAALRHSIDDRDGFESMVAAGEIRQAPAGTDADYFLLSFARELDAVIVSNDRFRDYRSAFPDAQERMIRYMIVAGEVVLERRSRRRDD